MTSQPPRPAPTHLVLIGYRGSGKTVVGRAAAGLLGLPFLDTDEMVEREQGRTIADIFRLDGEARFRQCEAEALVRALRTQPAVIAVGGGAVLAERNREELRTRALCVWLAAGERELARRIAADDKSATQRPSLTGLDPAGGIARVLAERMPLYAELAAARIETDGLRVEHVAQCVAEYWRDLQSGRSSG